MTKPTCYAQGCSTKFERYATFSYKKGEHQPSYATPNGKFCMSCLVKDRAERNDEDFIGILKSTDFKKYEERCKNESPFYQLETRGVVKLDVRDYNSLQWNLSYLAQASLKKIEGKKMNELPDNFSTNCKFHRQRVWKQIYPKDETNNGLSANDHDSALNNLKGLLEEILCPHEYYGRLARLTYESIQSKVDVDVALKQIVEGKKKVSLVNGNLKGVVMKDDVLELKNANILGRGPDVDEDQQPHVDSFEDDLILIMPLLSSDAYTIKCFHSSHQINYRKLEQMLGGPGRNGVEFPLSLLREELVGSNEVIILRENTIHCGGRSSGQSQSGSKAPIMNDQIEKVSWFQNDCATKPTDVSIQFTFRNNICPFNDPRYGRAEPRWIYKVGDCIERENEWKDSIQGDKYQARRTKATEYYFKHLLGGRSNSRKRKWKD